MGDSRPIALFGSGATVPLGCPTTSQLTSELRATKVLHGPELHESTILEQIGTRLDQHLASGVGERGATVSECNFEHISHVIEQMLSLKVGWRENTRTDFRPLIAAFVKANDSEELFSGSSHLRGAWDESLRVISRMLTAPSAATTVRSEYSWFCQFIERARQAARWDFATLNYDTVLDEAMNSANYTDGFNEQIAGYLGFDPQAFSMENGDTLLHLHGSILFGYGAPKDTGPEWEDMVKYSCPENAEATWHGHGYGNVNMANELSLIGPMITGLHKPHKILAEPYLTYYHYLQSQLRKSARLLICGFSFQDEHISSLLRRHSRWHGENRRIVVIDYFSAHPETFSPDPSISDWPSEATSHYTRIAANGWPFTSHELADIVRSEDGCFRFYPKGFERAVVDYGDDILKFLTQ